MRFISLRRLAASLKLDSYRANDELVEKIKVALNQHFFNSKTLIAFGQEFTSQQLTFVLNDLKVKNHLLFNDWIENDRLLVEYLFSAGEIILPSEEVVIHKENELFQEYQAYVSNYLAPILSQKIAECIKEGNLSALADHSKFSLLLPKKNRIEIHQSITKYLRQLLAQLKVSQDEDLQKQLRIIFSPEFVQLMNELDECFYADSIYFFEIARLVVQRNDLNLLVLDKIKSAILSLNLSKEDFQKVIDFINSSTFEARVKKPRSRINEMVKSPFFKVAVIVLLVNFIFLDSEVGGDNSSTKEEVFADSLTDYNKIRNLPLLLDTIK